MIIKVVSVIDREVTISLSSNMIDFKEYKVTPSRDNGIPVGVCIDVTINLVFLKYIFLEQDAFLVPFDLFRDIDENLLTAPKDPVYCVQNCLEQPFSIDVWYTSLDDIIISAMAPNKKYIV
jgi:hypothetical protein